jgi:hypothetical protein
VSDGVDVRVIPQPNVQLIYHQAPRILSTPWRLLRPLASVDELGDLTRKMVGRRPTELGGHDDLVASTAQPDEPDPAERTGVIIVSTYVVDLDLEYSTIGRGGAPAVR